MRTPFVTRLSRRVLLLLAVVSIGVASTAYAISFPFFVSGTIDGFGPFHDQTVTLEIYELILSNNNQSGFHTHPGPAYVVVATGTLLEDKGCGVTVEHQAGSAFQEEPGEVHNVTNTGHDAVKLYVMQIVPLNTPDFTDVDPPACK